MVVAVRGVEPAWLSVAALVSGVTFVIGELLFGVAAARRRTAPRGAAILFAIAIPLGLAIDLLPQLLVPIPLFFTGAGVYVGLGLLALSIARLGTAARRPRVTGDADGGGGLWGPKRQRGEPPVVAARTQLSPAGRNARASHGRS